MFGRAGLPVAADAPTVSGDPLIDFLDGTGNGPIDEDNQQQQQQQQTLLLDNRTAGHAGHSAALKLAYTTAQSAVATLGIVANLLILLIIVINTKQKCPNLLNRTGPASHTNYHFVLLFQLTLTGLLLSGYVLFTQTNLHHDHQTPLKFSPPLAGDHYEMEGMAESLRAGLSPLSIYLASADGILNPFGSAALYEQRQRRRRPTTTMTSPQLQDCILLRLVVNNDADRQDGDSLEVPGTLHTLQGGPMWVPRMISSSNNHRPQEQHHHLHPHGRGHAHSHNTGRHQWQHMDKNDDDDDDEDADGVGYSDGDGNDSYDDDRARYLSVTRVAFELVAAIHIWTVAALAYDRYCAIAHPLEYLRALSTARARSFLLVSWLVALLLVVLLPIAMEFLETWAASGRPPDLSLFETGSARTVPTSIQSLVASCNHTESSQASALKPEGETSSRLISAALFQLWRAKVTPGDNAQWDQSDGSSGQDQSADNKRDLFVFLVRLVLSCTTFLLFVVAPLSTVTTCNLSIYGIVKGHERRMSASSGSQQHQPVGNPHQSYKSNSNNNNNTGSVHQNTIAGLKHNLGPLFRRDASFCGSVQSCDLPELNGSCHRGNVRACKRSDTCSSTASSIFGKLIRASHQVGSSMVARCERSPSASSTTGSSDDHHEHCTLITSECQLERRWSRETYEDNPHSTLMPSNRDEAAISFKHEQSQPLRRRLGSLIVSKSELKPDQQPEQDSVASSLGSFLGRSKNKKKLKRKLSDKGAAEKGDLLVERNNSCEERDGLLVARQRAQSSSGRPESLNCACRISPTKQQLLRHSSVTNSRYAVSSLDSENIMRQLKLAGLSFAGIAINQLIQSDGQQSLNRFSSCSLGNLTANHCAAGPLAASPTRTTTADSGAHLFGRSANGSFRQQRSKVAQPPTNQPLHFNGQHRCPSSSTTIVDSQQNKHASYVTLTTYHCSNSRGRKYSTRLYSPDPESLDSRLTSASKCNNSNSDSHQHNKTNGNLIASCSSSCSHCRSSFCGSKSIHLANYDGATNQYQSGHLNHLNASNPRMQFNVVFNIVVWLMMALFVCSLPQYCLLVLLSCKTSLTDEDDSNSDVYQDILASSRSNPESLLKSLLKLEQPDEHLNEADVNQDVPRRATSIEQNLLLLTGVCQVCFMLLLPLNAWLYGIRSRSLKTTLQMMLRKYISKRQASIEIDQRRKSVQSMRSRESSIAGVAIPSQQQVAASATNSLSHNQQLSPNNKQHYGKVRTVRRCASFNVAPTSIRTHHPDYSDSDRTKAAINHRVEDTNVKNSCGGDNDDDDDNDDKSIDTKQKLHVSSIRFVLGADQISPTEVPNGSGQLDSGHGTHRLDDEEEPTSKLLNCCNLSNGPSSVSSVNSLPKQVAASNGSSLISSLASSNKSLLAASIGSSRSAAFLLLNQTPDKSVNGQTESRRAEPVSALKGGRLARMRHQSSTESAGAPTTSAVSTATATSRARPPAVLVRVQSSPGKLVAANRLMQNTVAGSHPTRPSRAQVNLATGDNHQDKDQSGATIDGGDDDGYNTSDPSKLRPSEPAQRKHSVVSITSDIRLFLTAADEDHQATRDLLPPQQLEMDEADTCNVVAGGANANHDDRLPAQEGISQNDSDGWATKRERGTRVGDSKNQQQLDYYEQIKSAITRYLASLRHNSNSNSNSNNNNNSNSISNSISISTNNSNNRKQASVESRRCSWCSLESEPNACHSSGFASRANSRKDSISSQLRLAAALSTTCQTGCEQGAVLDALPVGGRFCKQHTEQAVRGLSLRRTSLESWSSSRAAALRETVARTGHGYRRTSVSHSVSSEAPLAPTGQGRACCSIGSSSASVCLMDHHGNASKSGSSGGSPAPKTAARDRTSTSGQQLVQQQASQEVHHLKPPSSLKLMFEPIAAGAAQSNQALYSSSLALSPIKECSSNHSCASSQSSLNSVAQQTVGKGRGGASSSEIAGFKQRLTEEWKLNEFGVTD